MREKPKTALEAFQNLEDAMENAGRAIQEEYERFKRRVAKGAKIATVAAIGLGGMERAVDVGQALLGDSSTQESSEQEPLHDALTDALKEALPGSPVRAVLQMDIERTHGTLRDAQYERPPALNVREADLYLRDALERFQAMREIINDIDQSNPIAAADALREAARAYVQELFFLTEAQVNAVEKKIMSHQFSE